MAPQSIIAELDGIITYCDSLKAKAQGLRRKLEPVIVKESKKPLSKMVVAEAVNKRRQSLKK